MCRAVHDTCRHCEGRAARRVTTEQAVTINALAATQSARDKQVEATVLLAVFKWSTPIKAELRVLKGQGAAPPTTSPHGEYQTLRTNERRAGQNPKATHWRPDVGRLASPPLMFPVLLVVRSKR